MSFFIDYILPVLTGAVIGFITNWLAIKMIFRPFKAAYFLGIRIPFTPGLIPSRKDEIAVTLGQTIAQEFLNQEVLLNTLCSEEIKAKLSEIIDKSFADIYACTETIRQIITRYVDSEDIDRVNDKIELLIENVIEKKFSEYQISNRIAKQIIANFLDSNKDSTISRALVFLVNGKISRSLEIALAEKIDEYIQQSGKKEIGNLYKLEVDKLLALSSSDIVKKINLKLDSIKPFLLGVYDKAISSSLENVLKTIQFEKVIEEQIVKLDMKEFEKLIMQIIKKELTAIEIIGGVLGGLIGIINIFI